MSLNVKRPEARPSISGGWCGRKVAMRTRLCEVLCLCLTSMAAACGQGSKETDGGLGGAVALVSEAGSSSGTLVGYFGAFDANAVAADPCSGSQYDPCCLLPAGTGMASSSPLVFPALLDFMGAGTLTVTDKTTGEAMGAVEPSPGQSYLSSQLGTWAAGDMLSLAAKGGAFPAFSGSVQSPPPLAGVNPLLIPGASGSEVLTIPTTADFAVSWTPDATTDQILGTMGGATSSIVVCYGHESDGQMIFPTELMISQADTDGQLALLRTRWTYLAGSTSTVALGATVGLTTNVSLH